MSDLLSLFALFGAMVVQVVIPPIPAELIVIVAGRTQGVATTTLVAGTGLFAGSLLVYQLSRVIQHRLDSVFRREKVEPIARRLRRWAVPILWVRILPYNPSDVISYAAGLVDVPPRRFVPITACTSYVRCLLLAVLGTRIEDARTLLQVLGALLVSSVLAWILVGGRSDAGTHRDSRE